MGAAAGGGVLHVKRLFGNCFLPTPPPAEAEDRLDKAVAGRLKEALAPTWGIRF